MGSLLLEVLDEGSLRYKKAGDAGEGTPITDGVFILTGGGITPEPSSGPAGTAVTLTVSAGSGYTYRAGSLAWRKAGEEGDWTAVENNGFTLPAYHVEIRALFDRITGEEGEEAVYDQADEESVVADPEEPAVVDSEGFIAISTTEQLAAIGIAEAYPPDGSYLLEQDLTLDHWIPLGSREAPFAGTFRGNGKTITINSFSEGVLRLPVRQRSFIGLFGCIDGGTVEDLGVTLNMAGEQKLWANEGNTDRGNSQTQYAGAVAAYAERAVFKNITLAGAIYLNKTDREDLVLGGLAGVLQAGTVSSVVSTLDIRGENTLNSGNQYVWAGGLVGGGSMLSVSDCRVEGSVSALSDWGWVYAGGAVGELPDGPAGVDDTASYLIDYVEHIRERSYSEITRVAVTGGVSITVGVTNTYAGHTSSGFAGGIAGHMGTWADETSPASVISQSYSTGKISGKSISRLGRCPIYAGGIVGEFMNYLYYNAPIRIEDCYSLGEISTEAYEGSHFAGGIVGALQHAEIRNSYAAGKVSASITNAHSYPSWGGPHAGGIAGAVQKRSIATSTVIPRIENCAALNPELSWGTFSNDGVPAARITNVTPGGESVFVLPEVTLTKNIAYSGMTINKTTLDEGLTKPDGQGVSNAKPPVNAYTGLGWDFGSVWTMGAAGYPVLQWQH